MEEIFQKSENTRATRSSNSLNLSIPIRRNEYGKNCLSFLGATIWNSIDSTIRNANTCDTFKHKFKRKYFEDLKTRGEDVSIITNL